ncbi:hypothetical protein N8592_01845 [Verrucomicrobia bacterium]|nr:hypothetical protein [Verrucomicrobiota bacterium]
MTRPVKIDKRELQREFNNSTCTLRELASQTGASYSLITKLASSEKWIEQRKEHQEQAAKLRVMDLPVSTCTPHQHVERSLMTGEQIRQLLIEATAAIRSGDVRSLKTLVDAWASWDNQMRKTHKLDEQNTKTQINVALLSSLPDTPNYINATPP